MNETIAELQARLVVAGECLRKSEERAAAGQLALELMHEIRNPLEALGNLSYLARGNFDDPEKMQSYICLADEQLATLHQLVGQTLGFARSSPEPKPSDLVAVVEAALRIHQRAIDGKKIHLIKDLPHDLMAEVHASEILQVLSNLLANALDAVLNHGTIRLRLRKRQNEIHFVIADNGHGIPAQHIDQIFIPFFTAKEDRGTGLGLALSKKIIDRHRGKIRLRSSVRPEKSGTTFRISLPI